MSSTARRFATVAEGFARRIASCPPDRWDSPTPCPPWTAHDLVVHVIDGCSWALDAVGHPVPTSADASLAARWDAVRTEVLTALDGPEAATVVAGPLGELPFKHLMGGVLLHDVLVHTWDLARATGGDEVLDPDITAEALARMTPFDELLRGPGMFGPRRNVAPDADVQARFLAFLGRDVEA